MAPDAKRHGSAELFEQQRGRLFAIAYGMLGSTADAEDTVQDAYLRWAEVDPGSIDSPAAYLTTVTTRLAIDRLRSARHRRETYVGPWLPEPLITAYGDDPADIVAEAERLSMAVLAALERLKPTERAVLLLREVFDLDYNEIAAIVDKSPANCRQIAVRARDHVGDTRRGAPNDPAVEQRLLSEYMGAMAAGDVEALARAFAEDVVLWSDGGGKARAARHLLNGALRVARHLIGVSTQPPSSMEVTVVRANSEPGFLGEVDGVPIGLVTFDIAGGVIVGIHALLNPDKLERLRRV
jgi:RNA polymerase sigma-70 factor (ECF subfamily)